MSAVFQVVILERSEGSPYFVFASAFFCRCSFVLRRHPDRSVFLRRHPERSEGPLYFAFAFARSRIGVIDADRR
jgi:hypothetical protein